MIAVDAHIVAAKFQQNPVLSWFCEKIIYSSLRQYAEGNSCFLGGILSPKACSFASKCASASSAVPTQKQHRITSTNIKMGLKIFFAIWLTIPIFLVNRIQ